MGSNTTSHAALMPEFRKKSHSKRRKIFVERASKKVIPIILDFQRKHGINSTDAEVRQLARSYAMDVAKAISQSRKEIFSSSQAPKVTHEQFIEEILRSI